MYRCFISYSDYPWLAVFPQTCLQLLEQYIGLLKVLLQWMHAISAFSTSLEDLPLRRPSAAWAGCSLHMSFLPEVTSLLQTRPDQGSMNEVITSFNLPSPLLEAVFQCFATTSCPLLSLSLRLANPETFQLNSRRQGGGRGANPNISLLSVLLFSIPRPP